MKTAVRQTIEKVEDNQIATYTLREVLEILSTAEIIQDAQIKIAYLHGGMNVLSKSEVGSDEYFANEFNDSI